MDTYRTVNGCGCARVKDWGYWRSTDRSLAGPDYLELGGGPSLLPWRNSERERASSTKNSVQQLCLQYCHYRILLSKFFVPSHWTRTNPVTDYLLGLEIRITLLSVTVSFTSLVHSLDRLSLLSLFCNEAPRFPWSGPLSSRRSSNGSSYSCYGHCAGQA